MPAAEYPKDHPVAVAVEPLRAAAVARAREMAEAFTTEVRAKLEAAGWDADKVAPYPKYDRMSKGEYQQAVKYYSRVRSLTTAAKPGRSNRDADIRIWSEEGVAAYYKRVEDAASLSYEAYVYKLIGKVEQDGTVTSAELRVAIGVWGRSELTVTVTDGQATAQHRWLTKTIVNRSPLGTFFNQWPTTRIKD